MDLQTIPKVNGREVIDYEEDINSQASSSLTGGMHRNWLFSVIGTVIDYEEDRSFQASSSLIGGMMFMLAAVLQNWLFSVIGIVLICKFILD